MVAQVTLSLLLLIGAGLFVRSLSNLRDAGSGISRGAAASAFQIDPTLNGYKAERAKLFYQQSDRSR